MSQAVPPEVRRFVAYWQARQYRGRPFGSLSTLRRALGMREETVRDVADWLEARGVLTLPRIGTRYRHWSGMRIDAAKARKLMGVGAS